MNDNSHTLCNTPNELSVFETDLLCETTDVTAIAKTYVYDISSGETHVELRLRYSNGEEGVIHLPLNTKVLYRGKEVC